MPQCYNLLSAVGLRGRMIASISRHDAGADQLNLRYLGI
jgi:hypothetical protein